MEFKHERRTNSAYVKTLDLELSGNQINLSERPKTKDSLPRKKLARSLRPCTLRRPMSATPSFGYRGPGRSRRVPPWGRPQSAEGSTGLRRSKLAANFSDSTLLDPDYCPEFGATYTLSSSQLLNSLMGSCSINEGLDSDCTPAPSPQPSPGDTIKAAAQLEPGLTSKPPLPPTPSMTADDIINLKFQRWFPDAVLESEIQHVSRTSLVVTPYQREEADNSDSGSVADGALSGRDAKESPLPGNISTFVKKMRTPSVGEEEVKKTNVRFEESKNGGEDSGQKKSPKIVIHEPDLYGCDIVTEEFVSDTKTRCLTPDYIASLKKSSDFVKGNNKRLSLADLTDSQSTSNSDDRSYSVHAHSETEIQKDSACNLKSVNSEKSSKEFFDSALLKMENKNTNLSASNNELSLSRNDIESPFGFETSASKYRLTSTPITSEIMRSSPNGIGIGKSAITTDNKVKEQEVENNKSEDHKFEENTTETDLKNYDGENNKSSSPPTRLRTEEDKIYHDHLKTYKSMIEDHGSISNNNRESGVGFDKYAKKDTDKTTSKQEKHAHFSSSVKSFESSFTPDDKEKPDKHYIDIKTVKQVNESSEKYNSYNVNDKILGECSSSVEKSNTPQESRNIDNDDYDSSRKIYELLSSHRSGNKGRKNSSQKTSKPAKEVCRAASVPPFPGSKLSTPQSKQVTTKMGNTPPSTSKKKVRRSMSYDAAVSPDIPEKDSGVSSYEDIVTMIKVLEKEDLESPVLKFKTSTAIDNLVPEHSSNAKAILSFLDEVEKGTTMIADPEKSLNLPLPAGESARSGHEAPASSRLGCLLNADPADLAQQVMTLTLRLEEAAAMTRGSEERYRQSVELLKQQKQQYDEAGRRQQQFIDQLLKEKRQLAVQYETAIKELEAKHETAIKVIEERHKVEMKKAQDKFNAAEKIRRDKWIDAKTKKIKELTVKGLEPELERMAATHQEEIAELRRAHQRHLEEAEAAWARRLAAVREQEASERQAAVLHEREAARHRLEQEMNQVEKSYQEQRRRLLEEVRREKELLQRQSERMVAEQQAELAKQVDEAKKKLQEQMAEYDKRHQEEIAKLRECLETEKTAWMARQKAAMEEKEAAMREELKRERDRHIELAIRRLEAEAASREQAIENKLRRLKESYDAEVNDLDSTLKDLRARLKDARADLQKSEDTNAALRAQLGQAQSELLPLKQSIEKLRKESTEALQRSEAKAAELQRELTETKQTFQEQVNKIHNEKERQLEQVYTRVKEAINKKEEALVLVTKQRDAALEQCSRLEKLLETQRLKL